MPHSICTYCHQDFMHCECSEFHPNKEGGLTLSDMEVLALVNYFYGDAGYISHEKHPLVHTIIRRLERHNESKKGS